LCQLVSHQLASLCQASECHQHLEKNMAGLKKCNCPQIVISSVQIQMQYDTKRKCCTQKCLICFFRPLPEELCQLVIHQFVSLCLALECHQHLKKYGRPKKL
jgi:hypothetical protein